MRKTKILFGFLLFVIVGLASCRTYFNTSTIEVELMKPGQVTFNEGIDTIAVFKRCFVPSDTTTFTYTSDGKNNWSKDKLLSDTSIHYTGLSNQCVDALVNVLDTGDYFVKVINYRDSMNYLFTGTDSLNNSPELYKKLGADAFIILDNFNLDDHQTQNINSDFAYNTQDAFPEFNKTKMLEYVRANLIWTIFIKGDSTRHVIVQPDYLYYGNNVNPEYFGNSDNHKLLLDNASIFMGKSIVSQMLPSLKKEERIYFKSNNIHMRNAEKFLKDGDWLQAAEIYNKETRSKKHNIALQAKYNMALVCEMEGNLYAATDWLDQYKSAYKQWDPIFKCIQYNILLEKRKKEIELLGKQVRNQ